MDSPTIACFASAVATTHLPTIYHLSKFADRTFRNWENQVFKMHASSSREAVESKTLTWNILFDTDIKRHNGQAPQVGEGLRPFIPLQCAGSFLALPL